MNKILPILFLFLTAFNLFGQSSYTGFIDKYPIELVTDIYSDGVASAIYTYSKFDEPIVINGKLHQNKLTLFEKDEKGKDKATLIFNHFDAESNKLEGIWTDLSSNKQLKITLTKNFDLTYGEGIEWPNGEILQSVSLAEHYFRLVISKEKDDFYARVSGIKIHEKKTDRLIQEIVLDCQLWGLNSVSVGDYNFDGIEDFSVFQQSHAGPNTSSVYLLFDPVTNRYFDSGFTGTSLEFDEKSKRIYEHNQCCAGRSHMNAEYKVVNNKMVLVEQTCVEYDEEIDDFKTIECL